MILTCTEGWKPWYVRIMTFVEVHLLLYSIGWTRENFLKMSWWFFVFLLFFCFCFFTSHHCFLRNSDKRTYSLRGIVLKSSSRALHGRMAMACLTGDQRKAGIWGQRDKVNHAITKVLFFSHKMGGKCTIYIACILKGKKKRL